MSLPSQLMLSPVPSSHCATSTPLQRTQVNLFSSSAKLTVSMLTTDDGNLIRFPEVDEQRFSLAKQLLTQGVSGQFCGDILSCPSSPRPCPPPLLPPLLGYWTQSDTCGID